MKATIVHYVGRNNVPRYEVRTETPVASVADLIALRAEATRQNAEAGACLTRISGLAKGTRPDAGKCEIEFPTAPVFSSYERDGKRFVGATFWASIV